MILVYGTNADCLVHLMAVREHYKTDRVGCRNAMMFRDQTERCERVVLLGEFRDVELAYEKMGVPIDRFPPPPVRKRVRSVNDGTDAD